MGVSITKEEKEKVKPLKLGRHKLYIDKVKEIKVAVVGASSTTGLMVTDMLVSR